MPRDLTPFAGAESSDDQFPVHLIEIALPTPWRATTLDSSVFFNLTDQTTAALTPGAGLTEFLPKPDLIIPQMSDSIEDQLDRVQIAVSNRSSYWYQRIVANDYWLSVVRIWEGRMSLALGTHPDAATFIGHVLMWTGRLTSVTANREIATLSIDRAEDHRRMVFPRDYYAAPDFKRCPKPESEIIYGYTIRTV